MCIIFIGKMEIKINFDQLFQPSNQLNTTLETPLSQLERSFQTLNDSFEYKMNFDPQFFQQRQLKSSQPHLLIDQQEPSEDVLSDETKKSIKSSNSVHSSQTPKPGQRLFYESQANYLRKVKQRELMEKEKQAAYKTIPFAPAINEKSRKMAEKMKDSCKPDKVKKDAKTSQQIKQEQQLKQCTFHPKTLNKSNRPQTKSKEELFYMLYSTSKIKQIKMAQKVEEEVRQNKLTQKKIPEAQFEDFLRRNEEYANLSKKKLELMKQSAGMYDFKTGQKLFSPKISETKGHQFPYSPSTQSKIHSASVKPFQTQDLQSKPCGIFKKKQNHPNKIPHTPETNEDLTFQRIKVVEKEQQQYAERYRQYSEEYDRKAAILQSSVSHHQAILEEPEHEVPRSTKWDQKVEFAPQVGDEQNLWNSAEASRDIHSSKLRQFMGGSEEDEHQPKSNYVMDILSNLIHLKHQDEEDEQ